MRHKRSGHGRSSLCPLNSIGVLAGYSPCWDWEPYRHGAARRNTRNAGVQHAFPHLRHYRQIFFTTHEMTILCHDLPFNQLNDRNVLSLCSKHLSSSVAIRIQYSISSSYCTNRTAQCVSTCVDHECLCRSISRVSRYRKALGIGMLIGSVRCRVFTSGQMRHYTRSEVKGASSWHRGLWQYG